MKNFKFNLVSEEEKENKITVIYENDFYIVKRTYYKNYDYTLITIKSKDQTLPELIVEEKDLIAVDVKINLNISNPVSINNMLKMVENVDIAIKSANKIKKLFNIKKW